MDPDGNARDEEMYYGADGSFHNRDDAVALHTAAAVNQAIEMMNASESVSNSTTNAATASLTANSTLNSLSSPSPASASASASASAAALFASASTAATAAAGNTTTTTTAAAVGVPSNITTNNTPLSSASHQSMLRQLAHSPVPAGTARAMLHHPNRNVSSASQDALRHPQQQQPSPQQQHPQQQQPPVIQQQPQQQPPALNINVAAANNNNNPSNIIPNPIININNNDNLNNNNQPQHPQQPQQPPQYNEHQHQHHHHHHNMVPERATETENVYHPCSPSGSASSGWSIVETSQGGAGGAPPSARSLHAAALLNGIMYVFGGYDGSVRVNTFHAFSFAEKRWSPVLPSANSAGPPSPRDRHVAVAFGNSFYVHGGFDGTSRVADLWAFDFSSMTWREIVPLHGRPPSPRHSHAAVVYGGSMFVFGGYDGSYKSDLNEYDFTESRWSVVPAAGRRPRARYRATCVVFRNSMISYGGHDGTRHLSDAHIFDFDTRTWSTLVTEGTPPIPRDSHVSVVHGNSMYCFGGSSGSAMNDLHELQLPPNPSTPAKWRPVKISGVDQPRHRFCHVAVSYNESMFVFGGYDGSERLNDFIRFDFAVYDLSFEVPPSTIISDFRDLINNETLSDVTFLVEGQPVYAHKLMLMRSAYFKALILGEMRESRLSTIRIEQVSHHIFLAILEYLYTDEVQIPFDCAMELFGAADQFCIPRLKTMCEKRMLQSITVENAAAIFHAADMHSANALRQKAKKYILSHFEEISKTPCFEEMGRSNIELVFELLQSR